MPHPTPSRRIQRGFTLIELLTVIAIIGILAAIIIPTVSKVRQTAKNAQCVSKLREWGRIVMLYANDNKGNYRAKDWAAVDGNGPYYNYFTKSRALSMELRLCPCDPEYPTKTAQPFSDSNAWRPTYGLVQGSINGNITTLADQTKIPLGRARSPSQYLLMMDSLPNDNVPIHANGFGVLSTYIQPLTREDSVAANRVHRERHGGRMINAVFGDGSMRRITYAPSGPGDPTSIQLQFRTWFQLY